MSAFSEILDEIELRGKQEGKKEGGIQAIILDNIEEGKTMEQIVDKLVRRFLLSSEEALAYYKEYAN